MIARLFAGFGFVLEGKRIFSEVPGIKKWVVVPFTIDLIIFWTGFYYGTSHIGQYVEQALQRFFGDYSGIGVTILYYVLLVVFWLVFVTLFMYIVYVLASVIAAPFYAIIAEKTLVHLGAAKPVNRTFKETLILSLKMLKVSALRGVILIAIGVLLFAASFVPGLNLLAAFASFVIIALDSMDYSFETLGYSLGQRFRILFDKLPEFTGMGAFVGLTVLLPGLILIAMPFAVIGSAALLSRMNGVKGLNDSR